MKFRNLEYSKSSLESGSQLQETAQCPADMRGYFQHVLVYRKNMISRRSSGVTNGLLNMLKVSGLQRNHSPTEATSQSTLYF